MSASESAATSSPLTIAAATEEQRQKRHNSSSSGWFSNNSPLSSATAKEYAAQFLPGAVQGTTTVLVGHPLDTAKTRIQVHTHHYRHAQGTGASSSRLLRTIAGMAKEEGARSLYRGVSPPLLMLGTKRSLQFAFWDKIKSYSGQDGDDEESKNTSTGSSSTSSLSSTSDEKKTTMNSSAGSSSSHHEKEEVDDGEEYCAECAAEGDSSHHGEHDHHHHARHHDTFFYHLVHAVAQNAFVTGAVAGSFGSFIGCPMHVVKIQTQNTTAGQTRNAWTCVVGIISKEGPLGLYRGFHYHVLKDFTFAGSYLGLYTILKRRMGELPVFRSDCPSSSASCKKRKGTHPIAAFIAGCVASSCAWTVLFPLDTIKTRAQAKKEVSVRDMLLVQMRTWEGARAAYRGLPAALLRAGPVSGLAMMAYEVTKSWVEQGGTTNTTVAASSSSTSTSSQVNTSTAAAPAVH